MQFDPPPPKKRYFPILINVRSHTSSSDLKSMNVWGGGIAMFI